MYHFQIIVIMDPHTPLDSNIKFAKQPWETYMMPHNTVQLPIMIGEGPENFVPKSY